MYVIIIIYELYMMNFHCKYHYVPNANLFLILMLINNNIIF